MKNKIIPGIINMLLLSAVILMAAPGYGQDETPGDWEDSLSVSFGLEWQKGNNDMLIYNYSFTYNTSFPLQWNLNLNIEGRYGDTDNKLSEANNKMSIAIERILNRGFFSLLYNGDIQEDRFQNIYTRINSGLGIKLNIDPVWWFHFSLSSIPVVDYTRTYDKLESETLWRLRSEAALILNFSRESENNLSFKFRHEPDMMNFSDYRYDFDVTLNLNIMENLSLQNEYKMEYVSNPLSSEEYQVKNRNHSITSTITLAI